jgi:uncharacterized protein with von Willebrand factor type A (vWA) domain
MKLVNLLKLNDDNTETEVWINPEQVHLIGSADKETVEAVVVGFTNGQKINTLESAQSLVNRIEAITINHTPS